MTRALRDRILENTAMLAAILSLPPLFTGHLIIGVTIWVIGYAALVAGQVSPQSTNPWKRALNSRTPVRMIFALAAAAPLIHLSSPVEWASWIAVALTLASLALLSVISRYMRPVSADAVGLPGFAMPRELGRVHFAVVVLAFAAPAAILLLGLLRAPGWVALLVSLPLPVLVPVCIAHSLRRGRRSDTAVEDIQRLLEELQPRFVLSWPGHPRSGHHIGMWVEYLKRVELPFVVMVRSESDFPEAVDAAAGVPVVYAREPRAVEAFLVPSVSVIFYPNNSRFNLSTVRFSHITHIFLGHGDSEKTHSVNPSTAIYDLIFVAGQAAIDRFEDAGVYFPREKFVIVGRPQVESVERDETPIGRKPAPTVLYAPTWGGDYDDSTYTSVPRIRPLIDALLARGCRIVFRPHPMSWQHESLAAACTAINDLLRRERARTGVDHVFGARAEKELSVIDCFNLSDAMIADVSSVVNDYLYSGKPIGLMAGPAAPVEVLRAWPLSRGLYVFPEDDTAWNATLDVMLGDDPLHDERRAVRSHYLGDFPADAYADGFVAEARRQVLRGKSGLLADHDERAAG